MAVDVIMPRLSDSMEEGTVLRWLKSVGDEVRRGDELVEIETDKANMTYEAVDEGVLIEVVAAEGETLPIGEVIARIGEPAELDGAAPGAAPPAGTAERAEPAPSPAPAPPRPGGRLKASPVARRVARERGVDLGGIAGTGPGGRIVKADVEAAAGLARAATRPAVGATAGPPATPPPATPRSGPRRPMPAPPSPEAAKGEVEVVELTRLQATVARRMAESKATVPHFQLQMEVDMTEAVRARAQLKEVAGEDVAVPTFNDMVAKACALALREFPRANGAYRDGRVELYSRVNVGVAVAARDALVVPTIFDADRKSLGEIAAESHELGRRVRDATITPPELSGGTFTVSNLGMFGVTSFSAVINPPQAALLAVGALAPRPAVDRETGAIVARDLMGVTLACDHRILYGADGARFLGRVRELLEHPLAMAL